MTEPSARGPMRWMARNSVAANLLMCVFALGGLAMAGQARQEVFPDLELDIVTVTVPYPGASPEEVEDGVLLVVEEAVRGIEGVKKVLASAREGAGVVIVELMTGADDDRALADVKSAVDRIRTLPLDAERPTVTLATRARPVIALILHGDHDEATLRAHAERIRDDLLRNPRVTRVDLAGVRPPEISVEIPQATLRAHGLTLEGVAGRIRQASVQIPAGVVRTQRGDVLLRTDERRDLAAEFREITLLRTPAGGAVRLGDVAVVTEGWRDTDQSATYNGRRAVQIQVSRVGDQTPTEISDIVQAYVQANGSRCPPGMAMATWNDQSEAYRSRVALLLSNAWMGLGLVLLALGLFLDLKLAFWVALGIPVSILGAIALMPAMDTSFNMVSLFAFLITLGIVVDDAIVVGESVYHLRRQGLPPLEAAVRGVRGVSVPVIFSVLTTVAAFVPLLYMPGVMGQIFANIPRIVIPVLMVSLIESLFILPAHLAHTRPSSGLLARVEGRLAVAAAAMEAFVERVYRPALEASLRRRFLTIATCVAVLLSAIGYVAGGHIDFSFLPKMEIDVITASATLPFGAPVERTEDVRKRLVEAAERVIAKAGDRERVTRGILAVVGEAMMGGHGAGRGSGETGGHMTDVAIALAVPEVRAISARDFATRWREEIGEIAGLDKLTVSFARGSGEAPIDVELIHADVATLQRAAGELAAALRTYPGVVDVDDGFAAGKPQLDVRLLPEAQALGLTETDVARQVRSAFYGAEALRQQRGRDEIRVVVRLPEQDRRRLYAFENLMLRTPSGGDVPLARVATVTPGRADDVIEREAGHRVVHVTADVVAGRANPEKVLSAMRGAELAALVERHDGLTYAFAGDERERMESLSSLGRGYILALFAVFALLAAPFRSYVQPLIVMTAIPFGLVGALAGHLLMGYDLSIISVTGIIALSGIVVNDSLVLVGATNEHRDAGVPPEKAVVLGATRRFRAVFLTTITTFFGLAPMILEESMQARFLIPMALSLGFGVMFSTLVTLFLVPSMYVVVEDVRRRVGAAPAGPAPRADSQAAPGVTAPV